METVFIESLKKENRKILQKYRDAHYELLGLLVDLEVDVISDLEKLSPELAEKLKSYYQKVSESLFANRPEEDDMCQPVLPHIKLWLMRDNHSTEEIETPFLNQLLNEDGLKEFKKKLVGLEGTKYGMFAIHLCCGKSSYRLYSTHINNIETAIEDFCKKLEVAIRLVHTDLKKEHL